MNSYYKFSVFIIMISSCVQATPVESGKQDIETVFSTFLTSIIEKADLTVDPCEHFEKYACSNVQEHPHDISFNQLATVVDMVFGKDGPNNEAERKVHDMHLSCVNMFNRTEEDYFEMVKELLEQVQHIAFITNENDVTDEDIANVFLKTMLLGYYPEVLEFNIMKNQLKLESGEFSKYTEHLDGILSAAGHSELIDKIISFMAKFENLNLNKHDSSEITVVDVPLEKLKETLPSKNINLAVCYKAFKNEFNFNSTNIKIRDIEIIKEVLKIFDSTDKATVYNYLNFRYIYALSSVHCNKFDFYYRYAVLSRFWNDNFNDEVTNNRFLNILDSFEEFVKNMNEKQSLRYAQYLFDEINLKRNVAKNYKTILSDEIRDKFYEKFDIDVNNYFVNTINIFSYLNHILVNLPDEEELKKSTALSLLFGKYDHIIKAPIKDKPLTYMYSVLGYQLWHEIFRYKRNQIETEYKLAQKCFSEKKIDESYDKDSLSQLIAQRLAYLLMQHDITDSRSEIYKEKNLIKEGNDVKEINDLDKLYYLTWAQYECETNKNEFKDFVQNTLSYSSEFSETFNCPASSAMNSNEGCEVKKCDGETQYKFCDGKIYL